MGFAQKFADQTVSSFPKANRRRLFSAVSQKFWKDSSKITTDVLTEMYDRHGLAHNLVNLLADKVFNKGFEAVTDNEGVQEDIDQLNKNKRIRFMHTLKEAYRWKNVFGYSLVLIDYMDAGEDLAAPVQNPVGITGLSVIDKRHIKKFIWQDELNESGDLLGVELLGRMVGLSEDIIVSSTRFQIVGRLQGRGILFPAFNWLELFDNNAWSAGQSFFRYGSGFPFLKIENASDDEIDDAEAMWRNVTARTGFVGDGRYSLSFEGAAGRALPVKDYHDVGLQLVSIAAGVPYALVVGAHAGTISGSETNSAELYDKIESIQRDQIEPVLWEFFELFEQVGDLRELTFTVKWEPLWQLDSKEIADIELKQAQTDLIYVRDLGVQNKNEVRRKREFRLLQPDPDFDLPDGQGEEFKVVTSNPFPEQLSTDAHPAHGRNPYHTLGSKHNPQQCVNCHGGDAVELKTARLSKLEENDDMERLIKNAKTKVLELYDFDKLQGAIDAFTVIDKKDRRRIWFSDDNQQEFLQKVDIIVDSNQADLRTVVDEIVDDTYDLGITTAQKELERTFTFAGALAEAKKGLKTQLFEVIKGLNGDVKRDIRNVFLDELQKAGGSSPAELKKVLKSELSRLKEELPDFRINSIVRTESSRAFNEANFRAYELAEVKRITAITARDDRVRPEHAQVDGQTVVIGQPFSNGYTRPPFGVNCRCTIIPVI